VYPKKPTGFFWVRTRVSEPCFLLPNQQRQSTEVKITEGTSLFSAKNLLL